MVQLALFCLQHQCICKFINTLTLQENDSAQRKYITQTIKKTTTRATISLFDQFKIKDPYSTKKKHMNTCNYISISSILIHTNKQKTRNKLNHYFLISLKWKIHITGKQHNFNNKCNYFSISSTIDKIWQDLIYPKKMVTPVSIPFLSV